MAKQFSNTSTRLRLRAYRRIGVNVGVIRLASFAMCGAQAMGFAAGLGVSDTSYADELQAIDSALNHPSYSHQVSYDRGLYQETYLVDDLTLTFRPVSHTFNYEFSILPNWTLGISRYQAFGEVSNELPLPPGSRERYARLEADHNVVSHNLYGVRYIQNHWLSLGYAVAQDDRTVLFRSPNKAYRLEDFLTTHTLSLGAGTSRYVEAWVLSMHGYLDYQRSDNQFEFAFAEGTLENRALSNTEVNQTSKGYVGSLGVQAGYDIYMGDVLIHPSVGWSHMRTLSGEVDAFQQVGMRHTTPERTSQFSESSEEQSQADANPASQWSLGTSVYWSQGWLRVSRQHTAGTATAEDIYSLGLGWRF